MNKTKYILVAAFAVVLVVVVALGAQVAARKAQVQDCQALVGIMANNDAQLYGAVSEYFEFTQPALIDAVMTGSSESMRYAEAGAAQFDGALAAISGVTQSAEYQALKEGCLK